MTPKLLALSSVPAAVLLALLVQARDGETVRVDETVRTVVLAETDQTSALESVRPAPRVAPVREHVTSDSSHRASENDTCAHETHELVDDLTDQIDLSIDGTLEVNRLLTKLTELAELPIEDTVDYGEDIEDADYVAYAFVGVPDGVRAHLLIDPAVQRVGGREYRTIRISMQTTDQSDELRRGARRAGPEVQALLNYDDLGNACRVAIMTKDEINFPKCLEAGVNPYFGEFASGAHYIADLRQPGHYSAETMGFKNGHFTGPRRDPSYSLGTTQLSGDLHVQSDNAANLLEKLISKKNALRGQSR